MTLIPQGRKIPAEPRDISCVNSAVLIYVRRLQLRFTQLDHSGKVSAKPRNIARINRAVSVDVAQDIRALLRNGDSRRRGRIAGAVGGGIPDRSPADNRCLAL